MILYFLFLINIGGFQVSLKFRPCPLSLALQYLYQSFTSKVAQKSVLSLPRLWPKLADSMCICIIKAIEISLPGGDQKHSFIKQQQTVFYLIQGNMGKTLFTRHIFYLQFYKIHLTSCKCLRLEFYVNGRQTSCNYLQQLMS